MVTALAKLTFEQFLAQCPDEPGKFELVNGKIVKIEATRAHKNVSRFLLFAFNDEIRRLGLNYIVDKDITIRTVNAAGKEQGKKPDVGVVEELVSNTNVTAYGALTEPIPLVVEVSSTNWDDDYIDKLEEYELLGIPEYWIVDYLAVASRQYLGNPKVPTVFVHQLVNGKYQSQTFIGNNVIQSVIFPELKLTVEQIIQASKIY